MKSLKEKLFVAAALIVAATLVVLILAMPRGASDEPLTNPNGYDDFRKGAALLAETPSDWPDISNEELGSMVASNRIGLEVIRGGLARRCCVVPWEMNATNSAHVDFLSAQKRAAQAFCAESRLALVEGRTNDAAKAALDCIRFGSETSRGGVLIDCMVGHAIKALGLASLQRALPGVDAASSREIIAALQYQVNHQEPAAEIFKRESRWARQGRFGSQGLIARLIEPLKSKPYKASEEKKAVRELASLYRVTIQAAAHAYELEHGKPPATAKDLLPQYLKSVPLDPTSGKELGLE
jgi:hypothetical protein